MINQNRLRLAIAMGTCLLSANTYANHHQEDSVHLASKSQCMQAKSKQGKGFSEDQNCLFSRWYVHAGLGLVSGDLGNSDVQSAASQLGFEVFDVNVDDSRFGFKLNLGTSLTTDFSLELGYTNLGEVSAEFSTDTANPDLFFDIARNIHPLSVQGFTLSGVYQFWQHEDWYLHARLGLFTWDGDYDSLDVLNQTALEDTSISGTDVYFGLGANYQIKQDIQLTFEWERYNIESESSDLLVLGMSYHFD